MFLILKQSRFLDVCLSRQTVATKGDLLHGKAYTNSSKRKRISGLIGLPGRSGLSVLAVLTS